MSSSSYTGDNLRGMVNVKFDEGATSALDRATKLLAGFPRGIEKATESALKRAGTRGNAMAAREVGKQYFLKSADFKKYTKSSQKVIKNGNEMAVMLNFRGFHVPLIRFKTSLTSSGLIRTQVKKSESGEVLKHVFQAEMSSGHVGLFERYGKDKLPIEQKFGPSVPQMMGANENLAGAVGEDIQKTFEERMEHEVNAILNGWRK